MNARYDVWTSSLSCFQFLKLESLALSSILELTVRVMNEDGDGGVFRVGFPGLAAYRVLMDDFISGELSDLPFTTGPTFQVPRSPWIESLQREFFMFPAMFRTAVHRGIVFEREVVEVISDEEPQIESVSMLEPCVG